MKYLFRSLQRSLHWDLFTVPNDGIISANSLGYGTAYSCELNA